MVEQASRARDSGPHSFPHSGLHIGIDLGGTKIAGVLLDSGRALVAQSQVATPQGDYQATLAAIASLVSELEGLAGIRGLAQPIPVGIGTPGVSLPQSGLMTSCNSVCLNGQPLLDDLVARLDRPVKLANDADCMALSEWHHYQAAADLGSPKLSGSLFGVILGTGVGGGWVHEGHLLAGPNGLAGEWGHIPLPYFGEHLTDVSAPPQPFFELESKLATRRCYCGRHNCIETFLSGPGLQQTHQELWQGQVLPEQLSTTWTTSWAEYSAASLSNELNDEVRTETQQRKASSGELDQQQQQLASMWLYLDMLARSLAQVVNVIDPQAIVLGGGLSNMACLYDELPRRITPYLFSRDHCATPILPPLGGANSGVFGAASLVSKDES